MRTIRIAGSLLLGAALMAGCIERNLATAPSASPLAASTPTGVFLSDATGTKTSVVLDPVGDVSSKGNDYQDIVRAAITQQGRNFVFVMELAAPLPGNPTLPSWADLIQWEFFLDTDPTAFPLGYPFTKNSAALFEFQIAHRVYRSGFTDPLDPTSSPGILVDRRPLLTGGQAVITPIRFSIEGAKLTWVVDASLLGDPSTFNWGSVTAAAHAGDDVKNGYNISIFDFAPDVNLGAPLATWPQ